jgi:tRNA threonylcarbamoyladenosine biosynthesis protein TsaB
MVILAVETSTEAESIALVEAAQQGEDFTPAAKLLAEYTLNTTANHSGRLMPAIDHLLQEASLSIRAVQGITLALGPGSFTGLRIGVSTVKGLAYALKVPVVGIPTLDALAQNVRYASSLVCPVLDARKKEVYAALYQGDGSGRLVKLSEDWVLSPAGLVERIPGKTLFLGNGVPVVGKDLKERLGSQALFADPELSLPRAANVASLSIPAFQKGSTLDLFSFIPIYVRRSEAEIHYEGKHPVRSLPKT